MATTVIIPQAKVATNQTIIATAAYTSTFTAGPWPMDFFNSAELLFAVTSCSGTLEIKVQEVLSDTTTVTDIARQTYVTGTFTTSHTFFRAFNGGNALRTASTSLAVGGIVTGTASFGAYWQVVATIGGSGGTSTFGVTGNFRS